MNLRDLPIDPDDWIESIKGKSHADLFKSFLTPVGHVEKVHGPIIMPDGTKAVQITVVTHPQKWAGRACRKCGTRMLAGALMADRSRSFNCPKCGLVQIIRIGG